MSEENNIDVMGFDDGMSAESAREGKKTAKRLWRYLWRQKGKLLVVLAATVMACVFALMAPLVIGQIINTLFDGLKAGAAIDWALVKGLLAGLLALYLASAGFNYLQQYMMSGVSQTLSLTLRGELNEKLARLPLSYLDKQQKGALMSRFTNDLERVADVLQSGLLQLMSAVMTTIAAVALMLWISVPLTVIALATIALGLLIAAKISAHSQARYARNQQALGQLNGLIEEYFTGELVLKAFNQEQAAIEAVGAANDELYEASRRAQFITNAVTPLIRLFNQFGYVLMAVLGAVFVLEGRLSLGLIQAFFQYVNQVSEPVTETAYIMNTLQAAIASAERVFALLDEEEMTPDGENTPVLTAPKGDVCFENVSFGYTKERPLIQQLSLTAKAGQKVAIVGPTGAGKTTLINLLMRFYETDGGRITIDGVDITALKRRDLYDLMGMVLQDTWLFGGTISENIAYGRPNSTQSEIINAAKAARADRFIRTLPQGYQTVLNDEADNISQGQRQLLTIARTILADPPILILDEATSSVDTRTEREIQHAMAQLMRGRTSFVIAHRLSTIVDADVILVMNHGAVIEQGTHEELLAQQGFYAALYNSQFTA